MFTNVFGNSNNNVTIMQFFPSSNFSQTRYNNTHVLIDIIKYMQTHTLLVTTTAGDNQILCEFHVNL